jgi:hypothetical protein
MRLKIPGLHSLDEHGSHGLQKKAYAYAFLGVCGWLWSTLDFDTIMRLRI